MHYTLNVNYTNTCYLNSIRLEEYKTKKRGEKEEEDEEEDDRQEEEEEREIKSKKIGLVSAKSSMIPKS